MFNVRGFHNLSIGPIFRGTSGHSRLKSSRIGGLLFGWWTIAPIVSLSWKQSIQRAFFWSLLYGARARTRQTRPPESTNNGLVFGRRRRYQLVCVCAHPCCHLKMGVARAHWEICTLCLFCALSLSRAATRNAREL
jgi:hypothetical protein